MTMEPEHTEVEVDPADSIEGIERRNRWFKIAAELGQQDDFVEMLSHERRLPASSAEHDVLKTAVHEAYVNAQRAVSVIEWPTSRGSYDFRHGLTVMQEDAVRAIREAAEENR